MGRVGFCISPAKLCLHGETLGLQYERKDRSFLTTLSRVCAQYVAVPKVFFILLWVFRLQTLSSVRLIFYTCLSKKRGLVKIYLGSIRGPLIRHQVFYPQMNIFGDAICCSLEVSRCLVAIFSAASEQCRFSPLFILATKAYP